MLNRRTVTAFVCAANLTNLATPSALAEDDGGLMQSLEALRNAMLAKDKGQFELLCADPLSYGHSSGQVQDKAEFITGAANPRWHWTSLEFVKPSIRITGDIGIARINITGVFENAEGKVTSINDGVLMIWQKQGGQWRLLARQAFKL